MSQKYWQRFFSFFLLLGLLMNGASPVASATEAANIDKPAQQQQGLTPSVLGPFSPVDTTGMGPVSDVLPVSNGQEPLELPYNQVLPKATVGKVDFSQDPVLDNGSKPSAMPGPLVNFEGMNNIDSVYPPDTNGEAGPNHYIQMVNLHTAIYSKTGTLLYGPFTPNLLWPAGDVCNTNNHGDPVVLYDQLADRWLLSQFAVPGPYYECVAVSKGPSPTNNPNDWWLYTIQVSTTKLNDYPKISVWPDAYYMTANQFTGGTTWGGAGVWALNRNAMLSGQALTFVYFDLYTVNPSYGGMLPVDMDGTTLPPAGSPGYFVEVDDSSWGVGPTDALRIWEFHVDWNNPANSTFGVSGNPNATLDVANFNPLPCLGSKNCIPQPGTTQKLDAIGDRLMFRAVYRNFGDHEAIALNHTVLGGGTDIAGIRWYEVRDPGGTPSIYQQGTFAPADGLYRWMGSLAFDHVGNLALGYSVSSSVVYPSIRYAGRLATDPLGQMTQGEASIIVGSGNQTGSAGRWGDYSAMSIDPIDDCTFWYTQEYIQTSGIANWQTRVASFKFPTCEEFFTDIDVSPTSLTSVQPPGSVTTETLSISNLGNPITELYWQLYETTSAGKLISSPQSYPGIYSSPAEIGPMSVRHPSGQNVIEGLSLNQPESWISGSPIPNPVVRYAFAQCPQTPNSFYVISGVTTGGTLTPNAWRYDSIANSWTDLAPIPDAREGPSAVCDGNYIYVMGGSGTNQFYIYDIVGDVWMPGPPLPRNVWGAATGAYNGKIFLIAGDDDFVPGNGASTSVDIYDIESGTWSTGLPIPTGLVTPGYTQAGEFVYVVGGWGDTAPTTNLNTTYRYNMQSNAWEIGPVFSSARADFGLAITQNYLYALGGDANGGTFFNPSNIVETLNYTDWSGSSWVDIADPFITAVTANNGGFCTNGRSGGEVWTTGGLDQSFNFQDDNIYRPSENCFVSWVDIPWISEVPISGTLLGGESIPVDVIFDSTGLTIGTYTGTLRILSNDPDETFYSLDVTLEVVYHKSYLPIVRK